MKCRACGGRGVQWRTLGGTRTHNDCPACEGTGQQPTFTESFRETRRKREEAETTRAATEGGPAREHGDPGRAEEDLHPHPSTGHRTSTRRQ